MEYIPKLNSVRTIAVFLVIMSHYFEGYVGFLNLGHIGVALFFFLSGFLITSLMVRDKERISNEQLSTSKALRNFYVRRVLRIFPLYYLVIAVLYFFGSRTGTHIREDISYYVFYLQNILLHNREQWDGIISHFWSLAVEEQYYVFWPVIFFLCPGKYLRSVVIFFGVASFGYTIYLSLNTSSVFYLILLATCAYKFCLGSLVLFNLYRIKSFFVNRRVFSSVLLFLLVAVYVTLSFKGGKYVWIVADILCLYSFIFLLAYSKFIHNGFWHRLLANKVMLELGIVSYGIYVYHLIVPWLFINGLGKLGLAHVGDTVIFYPLCILLTIGISFGSYYVFENHFLKLKDKLAPSGS